MSSILQASPVTPAEGETLAHIKRFIRGLDQGKLATFLRFTTASDMLLTDTLKIVFTNYEGLQRRPVAHTCGYTLEVPSTYSNFCELRGVYGNFKCRWVGNEHSLKNLHLATL